MKLPELQPIIQNDAKRPNSRGRSPPNMPSQEDMRSISSNGRQRSGSPTGAFQQAPPSPRSFASKGGRKGWGKEKAAVPANLPFPGVQQHLKANHPRVRQSAASEPFRLPPPGGALGKKHIQKPATMYSSSEATTKVHPDEPASITNLHFSWDAEFEHYLRQKVNKTGNFIGTMSASPADPEVVYEPMDREAVLWFRDNYPEPPPTHRRDVHSVQEWLEGQMHKLEKSLQQQGQAQRHQAYLASLRASSMPVSAAAQPQQPHQPQQQQQPLSRQQTQQEDDEDVQGLYEVQQEEGEAQEQQQTGEEQHDLAQEANASQPGSDSHSATEEPVASAAPHQQQQQELPPVQPHAPTSESGHPHNQPPPIIQPHQKSEGFALSNDGRRSVQISRDSEGFLSTDVLTHQERLFTKCMEELCGQTATICVERGHRMWQLWAALRHMLRLVLQDRETSRHVTWEARRSELSVVGRVLAAQKVTEGEMEEVKHMNDVLNRRVLSRQMEVDKLRDQVSELENHIANQANFNPTLMQHQIDELQVSCAIYDRQVQNLNAKNDTLQADLVQSQKEVQFLSAKLAEVKNENTGISSRLAVRTPRPHQPRMPPWELINDEETQMAQLALREGCSPKDMHRLMLGISFSGCNILPWVKDFMGCCRAWTPSAKGDMDVAGQLELAEGEEIPTLHHLGSLTKRNAAHRASGLPASNSRPTSAAAHPKTRKSKILQPVLAPIKELVPQLSRLIQAQNVPRMLRSLPAEVVQAVSQMANHGVDPDSMACLLLGTTSPDGFECTPYKSLAGILALHHGGTPDDIGGPLTEALHLASMSTVERIKHLEGQLLQEHRLAVKYKRAIVEQRRLVEDQKEQEEKQQARKVPRPVHPLTNLMAQKRAEFFTPLGTDPSLPLVLQSEAKLYCRNLEKADIEKTVNAIWKGKEAFEQAHGVSVLLSDYLYIFLQKKHQNTKPLIEAAYNLLYNLSKHMYDPDCSIFIKVFMNEVDEDIVEIQEGLPQMVMESLRGLEQSLKSKVTGWLLKNDMRSGLRKCFKYKTEAQMLELFDALDSDEPREMVNYYRLFDSDNDGNQGVFAEAIRQQALNEHLAFYQAVEDALLDNVEKTGSDVCTPQALSLAFKRAHPHINSDEVETYQERVFASKTTLAGEKPAAEEGEEDKAAAEKAAADKAAADKAMGKGAAKKAGIPLTEALQLLRVPITENPRVDTQMALDLAKKASQNLPGANKKDGKGKKKKAGSAKAKAAGDKEE